MIENIFRVSLRLISNTTDFRGLIPDTSGYKAVYRKKGEGATKSSTLKALANVFVVDGIYTGSNLDGGSNDAMVFNKLASLMDILSVIDVEDIKREVYISGIIENEQFGFSLSSDLIQLFSENGYSLSFSGIAFCGE